MAQDHDLEQAVLAELAWEPSVTAAHLGVSGQSGVVTLAGHVGSYPEKLAAEQAALRVRGVKGVAEEIEIRLPFERRRDEEDIASAALERLAWSAADTGSVCSQHDRQSAAAAAWGTPGTTSVINDITVT